MKYRHLELLGVKTISADQTEVIDIDLSDPVTQILIDIRCKHAQGQDVGGHPAEAVTNIELVDGSEVLFGLTGLCAHALDIYDTGIHPRGGWQNYLATTYTDMILALNFGRFLYDPLLALDPSKFRNLQLKITHDVSAGGMGPTENQMSVYAEVFDEKTISPIGFLMSKEIKSWSGTAGAHEYTDLPVDFKYRKLLIQSLKRGSPPHWILGNAKLSEDQDKKIVFNDGFRALIFSIARKNAFIRETWNAVGQTSGTNYLVAPTMETHGVATGWSATLATKQADTYDGDGGRFVIICEGLGNIVFEVSGWAPHGVLCIPFGDQNDMEDWYDVSAIGSLKLDVTDGVTTTTQKIFIQQLRPY
ncbi:hypothetical protein LCGC14_0867580 [marine sediment metagenome]|uniref:Uncharacterized protein n=1 Tax=marine sediment metagenome TaxID=412755 RepID=A0A0F9P5J4_9ZZZZ|nr:hypothetical protein [Desulfobacterales bacterium]